MAVKIARAEVRPRRQRTQYSCMSCSMAMCLTANGLETDEDTVNEVMGARPMRGAAWEQALACAQHYGMRATLTVPATLAQVKAYTDRGVPVMIAWNPEGREWSHASVVVDVVPDDTHGFMVHVADPNIPDPEQTIRIVTKDDFYRKWYEKWPSYLVRRPAMAIEREITPEGRQVMARLNTAGNRTKHPTVEDLDLLNQVLKIPQWETQEQIGTGYEYKPGDQPGWHLDYSGNSDKWWSWDDLTRSKPSKPHIMPHQVTRLEELGWLERANFYYIPIPNPYYPRDAQPERRDAWVLTPDGDRVGRMSPQQFQMAFPPPPPPPPPQHQKTVVDSALAEKFRILDKLISDGFPEARDAAQAVKSVYESGGKPTDNQLKHLRNMMYRSRMRAEADHFRVASADGRTASIRVRHPERLDAAALRVIRDFENGDISFQDLHEYMDRRGFEPADLYDYGKIKADPEYVEWERRQADTVKIKQEDVPVSRHGPEYVEGVLRRPGAGRHHTRDLDVAKGKSRKPKHQRGWADREGSALELAWGDTCEID